ncbi:phage tail assembly protein (plasmid) [Orbus sturtevantii]|uniref:phage tail assembly protein n=1 Tax=Orbus sturtevantii TaxID=3074109 RepID=UPI00370CFF46
MQSITEKNEFESTKVITLITPIANNDNSLKYESVQLREPTILEMENYYNDIKSNNNHLSAVKKMVSLMSAIPMEITNKLKWRDFKNCESYLMGFFDYTPE